jgi:hypothetical protein
MRNILLAASKADAGKTTIAAAICQILADARQLQNVRVIELESEKRLERRITGLVEHHALDARKGEEDAEFKHLDPIINALGSIDRPCVIDTAGGQLTPILNHILNYRLERTARNGARLLAVLPMTIANDSRRNVLADLPVLRAALPEIKICVIKNECKGRFARGDTPRWPELEAELVNEKKRSGDLFEVFDVPGVEIAPKVADAIASNPLGAAVRLTELDTLAALGLTDAAADRQAAAVEDFLDVFGAVAHGILTFAEWPIPTLSAAE